VGFDHTVDLGRHRWGRAALPVQGGLLSAADVLPTNPGDGVEMHPQGFGDPSIASLALGVRLVGVEQNTGAPRSACRRTIGAGQTLEMRSILVREKDFRFARGIHR